MGDFTMMGSEVHYKDMTLFHHSKRMKKKVLYTQAS